MSPNAEEKRSSQAGAGSKGDTSGTHTICLAQGMHLIESGQHRSRFSVVFTLRQVLAVLQEPVPVWKTSCSKTPGHADRGPLTVSSHFLPQAPEKAFLTCNHNFGSISKNVCT